ncbi:MAG: hypothetical protein IIB82_17185 [Bacteroidetes bacterium]|nr:hypothetical protein [Bacteroidota bacterium]
MTVDEIDKFISNNSETKIQDYFNNLVSKLKATNSRNDKLTILMGILIVFYFVTDLKVVSKFSLGPIELTDFHLVKLFIPLAFSYVLLVFATLNAHRAQIIKNIRQIGKGLYQLNENVAEDSMYSNVFLQMIMPFSFWEELNSKFMKDGNVGCLTIFLTIPLYPILLTPFVFEYIAIKNLIINNWQNGWIEKGVIILTIWILISAIIYYIKLMKTAISEVKTDFN